MDLTPIRPIIGMDKDHAFEMELLRTQMEELARKGPTKHGQGRYWYVPWRKGFFGRLFCLHLWKKGASTAHNPLLCGRRSEFYCLRCGKCKVFRDEAPGISYYPPSYYK